MVCGKSVPHDVKMADERVRVSVVDDQASFRLATAATLAAMDDFIMAGECETGESPIELIPERGAGIVSANPRRTSRFEVLLMSTYDVEDLPAGATDCGAAAYLHKEHLSPDLLTRLWRAAN
jgi:DNA-binding NarL/FixJ family response regulator